MKNLRIIGVLVAPLPILALAVVPASASSAPATRVALTGEVVPGLAQTTHTGTLASAQQLSVEVSLAPRNQAQLDAFIKAVSTPTSPQYKHYLTVTQYAQAYGASDASIAAVTSYLKSQGLSVGAPTANHLTLSAGGSAAQVEKAFGVSIGTYRAADGTSFYANAAAPTLPTSISSVVTGIAGLSTKAVHTAYNETGDASSKATTALTPTNARSGYNLTSTIKAGDNGKGQTVALAEFSAYTASDVAAYNTKYSLGVTAASVVKVDGGTTDKSGQDEDELDIEVEYALAPGATVKVYEAPNSDAGEVALYSSLASSGITSISSSWGEPETEENNLSSDDADFQEMAAQGQSMFAASGDSGADDNGSSLSVDYPASDPFVSGVGGTALKLSSGAWSSETAWSDSGGGVSVEWATPSFQSAVNKGAFREVPDVTAAGASTSPWYIYTGGSWTDVWGTSAAAPNWAAFTADYNTTAVADGKAKFGFANSFIYTVAQSSEYSSAFHDVTSGNNGGYSAKVGYDEVSGWGSYNGGNFIADEL